MTPTPTEEAKEQQDDQALGHVVKLLLKSVFGGRQGAIIITLLLGFGGLEGWRSFGSEPVEAPALAQLPAMEQEESRSVRRLEHKLDEVISNTLEVKITVKAMLDTMPEIQRERASRLIKDRLEVLAEARRQTERQRSEP